MGATKYTYQNLSLQTHCKQFLDFPFYYYPGRSLPEGGELLGWHEEVEWKFFRHGTAEITCGPRVFLAEAGDLVVVNSCELHSIRPYGTEPVIYDLLMLGPQSLYSPQLQTLFSDLPQIRNVIRADSQIRELMNALISALQNRSFGQEFAVVGYISLLLSVLSTQYSASDAPSALTEDAQKYLNRLRPAVAMMQERYGQKLTTEDLASHCGLSLYHFCRLFKQITGYSPMAYLNKFRVYKAKLLLRTTDLSVSAIAEEVGFFDPAYFSRCFKKSESLSPMQYRERAK